MYRKRRRFRRRTRFKRRVFKRRSYKRPKTEVKVFRTIGQNQAIHSFNPPGFVDQLPSLANMSTDWLSLIVLGTSRAQRIGNQIYVKFVTVKITVWSCPVANTVGSSLLRMIIGNWRIAAATAVPNFFSLSQRALLTAGADREVYDIKHDRVYTCVAPTTRGTSSTDEGGFIKQIFFKIPMYRNVTYDFLGRIKNDRDVLSFGAFGQSTSKTDNKQIACMDYEVKIYYTD